jgi:hypothetical protein
MAYRFRLNDKAFSRLPGLLQTSLPEKLSDESNPGERQAESLRSAAGRIFFSNSCSLLQLSIVFPGPKLLYHLRINGIGTAAQR